MTRQEAYIAELSQLLFYMTPWDKATVLKGITAMINHPETGTQTMEEMGTPMKLAVTLHRQYTPTPEPTEEPAAEAPAAVEEAPVEEAAVVEEVEAVEEAPAEEAEAVEEAPAEEVEAVEESPAEETEAVEESPAEEAEAVEDVPAEETEAVEEAPAEEFEAVEEAEAAEEAPVSLQYEEKNGQEKIFAEIYNAVTEAQSAVPVEEPVVPQTKRKARYWFLIPYIAFAVAIGVPATLVFALANTAVFAVSLVSLCSVVYLVIFQLLGATVLATKLIILGLTLLMLVITILLNVMTVWFLRTATVGFPRFLIDIAKNHGYREVEVQ